MITPVVELVAGTSVGVLTFRLILALLRAGASS